MISKSQPISSSSISTPTPVPDNNQPNKDTLIANLKKKLDGFGVTVGLIKDSLPQGSACYVTEIPLSQQNEGRLFMLKGNSSLSCIVKTDKFGLHPELLDEDMTKIILNSAGLKGGQYQLLFAGISLGAVGAGMLAKFIVKAFRYKHSVPNDVQANKQTIDAETDEVKRVELAINTLKNPSKIDHSILDKNQLNKLAAEVNAAIVHYSGNCTLLSHCLLYNLVHGEQKLAAINSYPVTNGLDTEVVEKMLFGKNLEVLPSTNSIEGLKTQLIDQYHKTGTRYFVLDTEGYSVPLIGESGHSLNAVILLNKQQKPFVQFVDAWKTSEHTPSEQQLSSRYKDATFTARYVSGDDIEIK